jgi:serine/threonine-protein kinase RsbT
MQDPGGAKNPGSSERPTADRSQERVNRIAIASDRDILQARQSASTLASAIGFRLMEAVTIATVVSELARNIVSYAGQGEILLKAITESPAVGLEITARDKGPGIADVRRALNGHSTGNGLGRGLRGVKQVADQLLIDSEIGNGTVVTVRKWLK